MPNEITLNASLSAYKAAVMTGSIGRSITGKTFTMNGTLVSQGVVLIGLSATVIPLVQSMTPHWAWFYNTDPTNYLQLQNGASGAVFARLYPGEGFPCPLDNACVPYGIANTAACDLEYMIFAY